MAGVTKGARRAAGLLVFAAIGCGGRSLSHDQGSGARAARPGSTGGQGGDVSSGGAGGSSVAGAGPTGGATASGGSGAVDPGTGGSSGRQPVPCTISPVERACDGCSVDAAYSLECPDRTNGVDVEGPHFLVWFGSKGAFFEFSAAGSLVQSVAWSEDEAERLHVLAGARDDAPELVTSDSEGILVSSPPSGPRSFFYGPGGWPHDAIRDRGELVVLSSQPASNPEDPPLELWRVTAEGSAEGQAISAEQAAVARLVRGTSPPWATYYTHREGWFLHRAGTATALGEAASGDIMVLPSGDDFVQVVNAYGLVEVTGSGQYQTFGRARAYSCPGGAGDSSCFTADVPPEWTSGSVLAAALVPVRDEAWLVALVADVEDHCVAHSEACIEWEPCGCYFAVEGHVTSSKLLIASLNGDDRRLEVPLVGSERDDMWLAASGTETGKLAIAVAWETWDASENPMARVEYTLIAPP